MVSMFIGNLSESIFLCCKLTEFWYLQKMDYYDIQIILD